MGAQVGKSSRVGWAFIESEKETDLRDGFVSLAQGTLKRRT
jgi:hypothetical protein